MTSIGVGWRRDFFTGFDNDAIDGFVGGKGTATVDILALMIPLFGSLT